MPTRGGDTHIVPFILNLQTLGRGFNFLSWALYPYRIPVPIVKEAEWTPESTCLVPEKRKSLTAAKIQTPNHSAYRTSL
jgi:hypothetical protein